MTRGVIIAISHGGGPLPLLNDPRDRKLVNSLKTRVPKILRLGTPEAPRAIVLVTAHWSTKTPTISNAAKHNLYTTTTLKYDAPGEPDVAKEVFDVLNSAGLDPKMDEKRGWDHGVFIPMLLINPKADVPIIQLSVLTSESPQSHYAMGLALNKLRDSNIAIVGSGFASLHNNMSLLFSGKINLVAFKSKNDEWSRAVTGAATEADQKDRGKLFEEWRNWPYGKEMHPVNGGDHFMPLIVCAGAGGDGEAKFWTNELLGLDMYSYYWE